MNLPSNLTSSRINPIVSIRKVIKDLLTFLGNTDIYVKPANGIPANDIASGVIPDVSNFITASVNNLANYYLKSETYTKAEVAALIGAIQQFHYEVYASTGDVTTPANNVLYLIGPASISGGDKYEEYVYANNTFVKIGDTSIDLSGYVTITALNSALTALSSALENGDIIPAMTETLEPWADQKAIATPDTYTDAVRTTGGDIPVETSAGSKPESIKPVAGSKWTAKMLFNGSYNMLNAVKWGDINNQPYVGGSNDTFVYFLVPKLKLGTFGTADENNGLLFTDSEGENVEPTSVYYKPLGATVPQSLTDGTSVSPTSVSYDGKTYKDYETSGAGWLIIPRSYFAPTSDTGVCAHIAWEDWYDKYVGLTELDTNPEAVVGILILEGLLALAHSDKYLRGINEEVCDNVVFGETSATITHMVDELSVAAASWTNSATGESDSHGNALYRHSATVSGIKQGGAACIEGEDGGIPLTVNGTTVSYIDTNATAPASVVFYEITSTSITKAYTDSVFNGSNINTETGVLPINDCSIEAQVAMDGEANITVKYAKNIVDQVAINATVDVPQIKREVEEHEERITELEDTAVRTGSYDASVAVGLADNFKGDTVVNAEFYKRKTGGTQSVGSGIAAIKEVRGKSIVWNQVFERNIEVPFDIDNTNGSSKKYDKIGGNESCPEFGALTLTHKYYIKVHPTFDKGSDTYTSFYTTENQDIPLNIGNRIWVCNSDSIGKLRVSGLPIGQHIYGKMTCLLIDLTLMFGAGNEPATVEEFEKMFPLDYYDYNAGEVIPFAGQNLVAIGRNLFNQDAFFAGKQGITKEGDYFVGTSQSFYNAGAFFRNSKPIYEGKFTITLDAITPSLTAAYLNIVYTDGTTSGYQWLGNGHKTFVTESNKTLNYLSFSYAQSGEIKIGNICVSFQSDKDGTYEPYEKHTLPLDPSQWRDKNGNIVFPYGGMHGVGTAYDYAKVDADGYIRKAVRVYERHAYESGDTELTNVITDGSTYTFYPLETPVEVELATPIYAKYLVDKDGTEEITPANVSTPYTTMANLSILYAMDARGEIKNLPKNYLSKDSAENMLNAMVSAGVIASYTMTYDAANERYQFTIVAQQSNE